MRDVEEPSGPSGCLCILCGSEWLLPPSGPTRTPPQSKGHYGGSRQMSFDTGKRALTRLRAPLFASVAEKGGARSSSFSGPCVVRVENESRVEKSICKQDSALSYKLGL